MKCEDYPCCGHEEGGCPTRNDQGQDIYPCASCGAPLPHNSPSAVCVSCHRRHAAGEDEEDCGCRCDDCECCYPSEPDDSMDGDAASALASAGLGTDEDYEHDTPLGDEYGGE